MIIDKDRLRDARRAACSRGGRQPFVDLMIFVSVKKILDYFVEM